MPVEKIGTTPKVVTSRRVKKTLFAAWLGFVVDMYDVYLPIIVLAPAVIFFLPANMPIGQSTILTALIFVAALIGRPIGAILFGWVADKFGRRRGTLIAVSGFGVTTLVIAAMPGYQHWGLWAVGILIGLRLLDGMFLGGQYTGATPMALEQAPKGKRGLFGGIIVSGYPLAYCVISLITFGLLRVLPASGLDSAYVQWGWRIPFVIGAIGAFAFAIWFSRNIGESESWEKAEKAESPLKALFQGKNRRSLIQVFILMSGLWLTLEVTSAILPGQVKIAAGFNASQNTAMLVGLYFILMFAYIGGGYFSQKTGRRRYMIVSGILTATVSATGYGLIMGGAFSGNTALLLIVTLVVCLVSLSMWGTVTSYIPERFPTAVRASGFGIGYSLAVIIPSFYAFYEVGLAKLMPLDFTPVVLLVIAGILIAVGAAIGPETKDVDMDPVRFESPRDDVLVERSQA